MEKRSYVSVCVALVALVTFLGCGMFTSFGKGKKAFTAGNYEEAEKEFKKAIDEGSDAYKSHVYLGRIYALRKDYSKGIAECKKAFDMTPKAPEAYMFLIVIYQLNGQPGQAERLWDDASNLPGIGKGFALHGIMPPPGGGELRPEVIVRYIEILKGTASQ